MYNLIFTLDYEIHGNGDGNPYLLMVEPTYRLMNLLEKYGAKLTIMADVAEILCFKQYYERNQIDKFHYLDIEKQLKEAIKGGHDVQLHIHSSYFKATFDGKRWNQCISEYNMATLPYERIYEMVRESVTYLNELLRSVKPDYSCKVFRAANWSMMPTENIYKALVANGIKIDTSVYKGGCQGGNVCYDYRMAYDNLLAYPASCYNINEYDADGEMVEFPIYTEMRYFWNFISPLRVFRLLRSKLHKHQHNKSVHIDTIEKNDNRKLTLKSFFRKNPWKFDFNQATGRQMIAAIKRIRKRKVEGACRNVVLIGHSKTFVPYNEKTLECFLRYVSKQADIRSGSFDV